MYQVYGDIQSGNCYKVKLLMSHLELAHEWHHIDILNGESRTEAFLAMNPNGKIPLLVLPDSRQLAESNAILNYLAEATSYVPGDSYMRAKVLEWQFFEQYSHEPYIATARFINKYLGLPEERRQEYHAKQAGGHGALAVMERRLATADYLVGNGMTIADITLYAYTHVADEGGFSLDAYSGVRAWLERVASHPRHVEMVSAASDSA